MILRQFEADGHELSEVTLVSEHTKTCELASLRR